MKKSVFLGWGLGSFTTAVLVNSIGLLHLRFMTDSLGVTAAVAGSLVALSKIYDAATDPIMGMISDQTRTRWGAHRPYLFLGAILCAVSLVMLFNVPSAATGGWVVAYMAGVLMLFSTAYTMFRIPYLAMGANITRGFQQRSQLMTFSVYGSSIGGLLATTAAPYLLSRIGSDRAGHGHIAWILAGLTLVGGLACFWFMKGAQEAPTAAPVRQHAPLAERLAAVRGNRPFLVLIGFKVLMFTGLALHGTVIPFYTRHVLKVSDASLASIFLAITLSMMGSQVGWVRLAKRWGRRNGLIAAALAQVVVMFSWMLVPAGHPSPWIQILGVGEGICSGGLYFGLHTILIDTISYDRARTGVERAGVFAGIFVMVEKITTALGVAVFGIILSAVGYVSAKNAGSAVQPASVTTGMLLALAVLPALAAFAACLVLRGYDLPSDASETDEVQFKTPKPKTAPKAAARAALGLAVALGLCAAPAWAAEPAPPHANLFTASSTLTVFHVFTGPDNTSHVELITLDAIPGRYGTGLINVGAERVKIGYSADGSALDYHHAEHKTLLIGVQGTMVFDMGDGHQYRIEPGTVVLAEDHTGRGHKDRCEAPTGARQCMLMQVNLVDDGTGLQPTK